MLGKLGLNQDLIERIVGESVYYGEPYMVLCRKCLEEYYVCLIIQVSPIDIDEYRVVFKGLIITVDKDKELDPVIEDIFRNTKIIKHYSGKTSFYIPSIYSGKIYSRICREEEELKDIDIKPLDVEDITIYLEED